MNCGTCEHWYRDCIEEEGENKYTTYGDPDPWAKRNQYGECWLVRNRFAHKDHDQPPPGMELAFARDYERYRADLVTHWNFGCVQYEAK